MRPTDIRAEHITAVAFVMDTYSNFCRSISEFIDVAKEVNSHSTNWRQICFQILIQYTGILSVALETLSKRFLIQRKALRNTWIETKVVLIAFVDDKYKREKMCDVIIPGKFQT